MKKLFQKIKKLIILILVFFLTPNINSVELSDSLKASVLTASPGNELYSTFGHTGIRIKDLKNGFDIVFNYGTFDFNTPNFYFKFALGKLDYMVSVEPFEGFIASLSQENRSIVEQQLNFNKDQTLKLTNLLIKNYQPENRSYRYKFFTDNCSTRVRDIIVKSSGDSLLLSKPNIGVGCTFRKLFTGHLTTMPWGRFGTELLLGKMTDDVAGYDALFLPDNLKESIGQANLNNNALVEKEVNLFTAIPENKKTFWFTPLVMSIIIIVLTLLIELKSNWSKVFDKIFFMVFGILGLFIAVVCHYSEHAELNNNYVILLLLPTHLIFAFLNLKFRKIYSFSAFIITLIALLLLPFVHQVTNIAILIISIAIETRLFFNFIILNRSFNKIQIK
jgi:hypothetical protein